MPAAPRDWAEPFLQQAQEDLRAAEAAFSARCESTFCMLLQMTFEKLAKAAFARRGLQPTRTHDGASRLLLLLARDPAGPRLPGYQGRVLDAVRELENAQPAIVSHAMRVLGVPQYPQLEYPWETAAGVVEWPAVHLPIAQRARDPRQRIGADLLKLARAISKQFNTLFP